MFSSKSKAASRGFAVHIGSEEVATSIPTSWTRLNESSAVPWTDKKKPVEFGWDFIGMSWNIEYCSHLYIYISIYGIPWDFRPFVMDMMIYEPPRM
jgi:hypothetical protein